MINRLVDALKNINDIIYHYLAYDSLSHARNFPLTQSEIDKRLNQIHNGFIQLESHISTIYKYCDSLKNKNVTITLLSPINLKLFWTIYKKFYQNI